MSDPSDYQDGMGIFSDLSDEDLTQLFSGEAPPSHPELVAVATGLDAARRSLRHGPSAETARRHVSAIAEASRELTKGTLVTAHTVSNWRKIMRRTRSIVVKVGAGVIAASMSMIGLAYAGVDLPDQASAALQKLNITLPNQAQGHDTADLPATPAEQSSHGREVSDLARSGPGGCAFGQSIAALASSNRQNAASSTRQNPSHRGDPCSAGQRARGSDEATGSDHSQAASHPQSPGYNKDNHPSGASVPGKKTNPTGNGADNHPADSTSGQSSNPTGNGGDNHPTDSTSGQSSNPTGNGADSHPAHSTSGQSLNPTG